MAVSRDTITQRIALDGAKEILQQLAALGVAGEKSIKQMQDAAAATEGGGMARLAGVIDTIRAGILRTHEAFGPLQQRVGQLGQAFNNLGAAISNVADNVFPHFRELAALGIGGAVVALGALVKSGADAIDNLHDVAQALGLTIKQFQEFSLIAARAGLDEETLFQNLSRFTQSLANAADQQRSALAGIAKDLFGTMTTGTQVLRGGLTAAQDAARNLADMNRNLKNSFVDTTGAVDRAAQQMFEMMGGAGNRFGLTLDQIKQKLLSMAGEMTPQGVKIRETLGLMAQSAGELLDPLIKAQNAFKQLGIETLDLSGKTRGTNEVLLQFGRAVAGVQDEAKRNQFVLETLGRGALKLIPAFKDLANGVEGAESAFIQHALSAIEVSKADTEMAARFQAAANTMRVVATSLKNQVGLVLSEAFIPVFDAITQAVIDNKEAILAWARDVAAAALPIIRDLISVLQGAKTVDNQWIVTWKDNITAFFTEIATAWPTIKSIFTGLWEVITLVTQAINLLFNSNLTPSATAAILVIGTMSGAFTAMAAAIGVVIAAVSVLGAGIGALAALFGAPVAVVAALVAAVAAAAILIVSYWTEIVTAFAALGDLMVSTWDFVIGKLTSTWTAFTTMLGGGISTVTGWLNGLVSLINSAISALGSLAGGAASAAGFAGGGPALGGGRRGPRDIVPAWLEPEEFVMRSAAVRHYGTDFLHSLNSMRFAFAEGGLVPGMGTGRMGSMMAAGGGGRPINLTILGETFAGLTAPEATAEKMLRFARGRQVRSNGRKPGWFS